MSFILNVHTVYHIIQGIKTVEIATEHFSAYFSSFEDILQWKTQREMARLFTVRSVLCKGDGVA